MSQYIVEKTNGLYGEISAEGAKNSALPILAASIIANGKSVISNVPDLSDTNVMCSLISLIGGKCKKKGNEITISSDNISQYDVCDDMIKKIRASFLLSGALLSRFGKVKIPLPGGCPIGVRPVDLHLKGFAALGAVIRQEHGIIEITSDKLKGADIHLDFPSVGATENIIMAAVKAEGETTVSNCAIEPEISDLADYLNKTGCIIQGAGTDTIKIIGVKETKGCSHKIIPDRIEAGTYITAAAAVGGDVTVKNVNCEHLRAVISKLKELNTDIDEGSDFVRVKRTQRLKSADIKTMPYPGFPTDMQPQFTALLASADGTGIINETIFENRFMHIAELHRMGADIKIEGGCAVVHGVETMTGAEVKATDLRAGAGLIIAGLCAEGKSTISDISHIERGYCNMAEKLRSLGAEIKKI